MEFCIYFTMDAELKERHISLELKSPRLNSHTGDNYTTTPKRLIWFGQGHSYFYKLPSILAQKGARLVASVTHTFDFVVTCKLVKRFTCFLPALDAGPATSLSPHFCPPYSDTGAIKRALPFELGGESLRNEFQTWPSKVI
jgi:hypothetical protein